MTYDPNRPPQPPHGQASYGQQPEGQQPAYGQPAYGQPQYPPGYGPAGYAIMPPARPTSVIVVAIIGIVWASVSLLCVPLAAVQLFKPDLLPQPATGPNPLTVAMHEHTGLYVWLVASNVVNIVLLIMLLVGSIGALRLRPWGRSLSIAWALIDLVVVILGLVIQLVYILPMVAMPGGSDPQMRSVVIGSAIVGAIFGLLFAMSLPILILIFYRRRVALEAFARGGR